MATQMRSTRFGSSVVPSRDGTTISYQTIGSGPALLVIPGALTVAADFATFAERLGEWFTVHVVERRGRGGSGPQGATYGIDKEREDILAVQEHTGATYLFGHSFGGLVALESARGNRSVRGVVAYEPGVSIDHSIPMGWADACADELAAGRPSDAFITFIRGINPKSTGRVPRPMLKAILQVAMGRQERRQKHRLLAGTILEHREAARLDNTYGNYREIEARLLLMIGARSARVTPVAATAATLSSVVADAHLRTMPKMDHFGPEKHPEQVAEQTAEFLLSA